MATITTRSGKGSPLTNSEVDSNFSDINTELSQKESASNKGVANGYASLDGSGKVPSTQLPSYVDDVVEGANLAALPATGETGKIYVTLDTNKTYRWSGSAYVEISASPGSTDAVTEGSTNLYFTNARARSAISASGSLSYNSSTGVLSYTQPTNVSTFTNDSGYITSSALSPYLTSATAASTYQTTLVSGTSIKTVNGQSVLGSGNIQIDGGVTSFNTRTGAVTLSSGDVTGALGYTPYNSTNPSGYITSSSNITGTAAGITGYTLADVTGTATSVMTRNASGDSAVGSRFHFTTCTADGGTFGLVGLNWGGAAGTYKNFEVYDYVNTRTMFKSFGETRNFEVYGALSAVGATLTSASTVSVSTWEKWTLETTGVTAKARQGSDANGLNFTSNARWTGSAWAEDDTAKKKFAYIQHLGNGRHEFRTSPTGAGVSWTTSLTIDDTAVNSTVALTQGGNQVLHAGNYTSYSPSLTGSGASGTWSINVTGSAGSASNAGYATYNQILDTRAAQYTPNNYQDYRATYEFTDRFTGLGDWHTAMTLQGWHDGYTAWQIIGPASTSAHENWYLRSGVNTSWNSLRSILHSGNYTTYSPTLTGTGASGTWGINVTGNAATASRVTGGNLSPASTSFNNALISASGSNRVVAFDGNGSAPSVWWTNGSRAYGAIDAVDPGLSFWANNGSSWQQQASMGYGTFNVLTALQQSGNQVLHAANYTSYSPSLTGSGASGTWSISTTSDFLHSDRDFPSGTLITTDINYAVSSGDPFVLEIRGNSYGNIVPLDIQYQGYIYSDTIINHGGLSNGLNISGLVAINNGGNLCFWFPSQGYWNGYYVKVYVPYSGRQRNRVTSISGSGKPTTAKEVALSANIRQSLHSGNYTSYSPSLTGSGASGTWGINITGNAGTAYGLNYGQLFNNAGNSHGSWSDFNNVPGFGAYFVQGNGNGPSTANQYYSLNLGLGNDYAYSSYAAQFAIPRIPAGGSNGNLYLGVRFREGGSWGSWYKAASGYSDNSGLLNGYSSAENGGSVILRTQSNGYLNLSNWIQVASAGLFSSVNGSHWRPSAQSFGSWEMIGSRNGYTGIACNGNSHILNWMVDMNGNLQGFYNQSYGWQMYWSGGSLTVFKNAYGGGTGATVLDSANYTSYSPSLTGSGASGSWNITAARANRANGNFYIDDNYGQGHVGLYESTRYQGVFFMGDSYKMSADGTSLANMYGIGWSHPNAGGAAGNLTDHGMLIINNGSFRCAISNSIVASGNITAYSDERLKRNWRDMPENFVERLAQVRVGCYERIDDGTQQVGVSAQSLQPLLPEAIQIAKDEIGTLSVSYGNAAMASAVELAKELVMLKKELAEIKSRLH